MRKLIILISLMLSVAAQAMVLRVEEMTKEEIEISLEQVGKIVFHGTILDFVAHDGTVLATKDAMQISKITFEKPSALFSPTIHYRVYPNPASEIVMIDGLDAPTLIQLISMTGIVVKSEFGTQLNVSDVPQGTYLLLVNGEISKLIIE